MAKLVNVNPGMTTAEATTVGSRNSWLGAGTLYFDPLENEPTDLEDVESGSSVMSEPSISGNVSRWSKDGIIAQIGRGTMTGKIRDTRGRYGDPKEWDHLSFTFSRDESARLRELGEAVQERMRGVIGHALREHPAAPDMKRQMLLSRLHDSSGNFHFHAILHRHAIKSPGQGGPLEASVSIDMMRNSEIQSIVQRINRGLVDAELGEFQIREAGVGENDVFADRNDTSRMMSSDDVESQPDRGPDPGQSIHEQARSLTPSEATLKRMVELQNKKVADAQKALEEAQRMQDGFQNLLAAEAQKNDAIKAQQVAEAQTEIAQAAQRDAEEKAAASAEEARIANENRTHAEATATDAVKDAEAAEAARAATEERLVVANTQIGDLEDKVENLNADIEQRDEEIVELKQEVAKIPDLETQLSVSEEKLEQKDKLIEKKDSEIKSLGDDLVAERDAHAAAIAVQAEQHEAAITVLRDQMTVDLDEKLKAQEARLASEHRAALAEKDAAHSKEITSIEREHGKEKSRLQSIIDDMREKITGLSEQLSDAKDKVSQYAKVLKSPLLSVIKARHVYELSSFDDDMTAVKELSAKTGRPDWASVSEDKSDVKTESPFGGYDDQALNEIFEDDSDDNDDDGPTGPS